MPSSRVSPSRDSASPWEPRIRALASALVLAAACGDSGGNPDDASISDAGDSSVVADSGRMDAASDGSADAGDASMPDSTVPPPPPDDTVAWVMSYFGPEQNLSADSLHFAYSVDGLRWSVLKAGASAYQPTGFGTNQIRDPFVMRKQDGTFVYLATDWTRNANPDYWSNPSPNIFVADSVDLITFTNPRLVQVTNLPGPPWQGGVMHAWAPEAYWDPNRQQYAIVWSGNDTTGRDRTYVSYTNDFTTILNPTPDVLFDPGYAVIDATIVQANNLNYLFFKDETSSGAPANLGKDIQIARSSGAALSPGTFTRWDPDYITRGQQQTVRQGTEGPLVIRIPGMNRWYMYADYYGNGGVFGCWTTTDLNIDPSQWTRLSTSEFSLPPGVRHANTVRVTQAELDAMVEHYGVATLIRTSYEEGGTPFYVAHSWYHGMITQLADRSDGQLQNDFYWRVVPGLSDPNDPDLVSFEAVNYPGRYLRIDSQNPNRYPPCDQPANRGEGLCWPDESQRNYLAWIDTYADNATFRADATFRRVTALDPSEGAVSFQWQQDPTRYLKHAFYQLYAHVPTTAQNNADSSFTIE